MTMRPDPTFHASPKLAMQAPAENYAYTLMLSPDFSQPDGLAVVDVNPKSKHSARSSTRVMMPNKGDEFHHFGWNACSSALSPLTGHAFLERRYLIIPGIRSSRIYIIDTKDGPTKAKIHKIIEPEEVFRQDRLFPPPHHPLRAGRHLCLDARRRRHRWHRRPSGHIHHGLRDLRRHRPLRDRSRRRRTSITISGGTCRATTWCPANGGCRRNSRTASSPEDLLSNKYGHRIHFWNLRERTNVQTIDLGANHQMALEVRPAHDPVKEYGFLGVVVDTTNLEGSIWTWWREDGKFHCKKTATIPPEAAAKDDLPPLLQGFEAVPPLVTDIDLSLDDRFLYVACWGTGEMRQYDVADPMNPKLAGSVHIGGITRKTEASQRQGLRVRPADGRDQPRRQARLLDQLAVFDLGRPVLSRRRRRPRWSRPMSATNGGLTLDKNFFVEFPEGYRSHQIRLEGGDCSTDSFCYPSV